VYPVWRTATCELQHQNQCPCCKWKNERKGKELHDAQVSLLACEGAPAGAICGKQDKAERKARTAKEKLHKKNLEQSMHTGIEVELSRCQVISGGGGGGGAPPPPPWEKRGFAQFLI